jgi:hypothetical protein
MATKRAILLAITTAVVALASDPFIAKWKPVSDKWRFSDPERKALASRTMTWNTTGAERYVVRFSESGSGSEPVNSEFLVDGVEHRIGVYTGIGKRIDERHVQRSIKSSKGITVEDYLVSLDGATLTIRRTGVGLATGRPLDKTWVYEKR